MDRTFPFNPEKAKRLHGKYCDVLQVLERDRSPEAGYLTSSNPSVKHGAEERKT